MSRRERISSTLQQQSDRPAREGPLHALSGKRATAVSTVQERDVIIIKNHASTPRHLNLPLGGESVGER